MKNKSREEIEAEIAKLKKLAKNSRDIGETLDAQDEIRYLEGILEGDICPKESSE